MQNLETRTSHQGVLDSDVVCIVNNSCTCEEWTIDSLFMPRWSMMLFYKLLAWADISAETETWSRGWRGLSEEQVDWWYR